MNSNEYQVEAKRTLIDAPGTFSDMDIMIIWNAIGLAGEAGEVANLVKKGIFHRHGLDVDKVLDELGDVLWYVSSLCDELGFSLEDVMAYNIDKLRKRYPDGFNSEDSLNRTTK